MSSLLVVRSGAEPNGGSQVASYFKEASSRAATTKGFYGGRLYRHTQDPLDHLILWHYKDVAAAEEGLLAVSKGPALPQYQTHATPADVRRTRILSVHGAAKDGLIDGEFLSVSVRVAEPGFGHELAAELDRIFTELAVIPGLVGTIVATNDTLDEEILGLCAWNSIEAFHMSLPVGVPYEVRLYQKVA